jgi:hypothetical protein
MFHLVSLDLGANLSASSRTSYFVRGIELYSLVGDIV